VIGVSADTPEKNERFRQSLELPFPLLGDPSGRILRDYRVRWPLLGLARRVSYVVGPDRKIRLAHRAELDVESHIQKALAAVDAAR
jgi:thioredoxin-dependent peroxiredoxin